MYDEGVSNEPCFTTIPFSVMSKERASERASDSTLCVRDLIQSVISLSLSHTHCKNDSCY